MKYRLLLASSVLILSFNVLISPSQSQQNTKCEQHQEIFTFQIPNYPIQHQGGAIRVSALNFVAKDTDS